MDCNDRLTLYQRLNHTRNNISVVAFKPVLLLEETGVPGENHNLPGGHRQTLSHINRLYRVHMDKGMELTTASFAPCRQVTPPAPLFLHMNF